MIGTTFTTVDLWMAIAIVLLLLILIVLALAEMSLSQMTRPRANALAEGGSKSGKALARLAAEPTRWVNPLLLTVNICQTVQATLTGIVSGRLFGAPGVVIGVVLNVIVFFVLAEAVPKTYAVLNPVRGAMFTGRLVEGLVSFWPLRVSSNLLIRLTNVIVKGEGLKEGPFIGEQEFLGIVEAAAEDSVIEHEERELIKSVIEFGDTVVREIMVPAPDVVDLEVTMTVSAALDSAVGEGFSRFPVTRHVGDGPDVVGMVNVKDLVVAERSGKGVITIESLVRPVEFVPETKLVADLMRSMQANKYHLAVVADEYGVISGIVTLEDCLEELVGEIVDEHDEERAKIQRLSLSDYLIDASIAIDQANEELGLGIPDGDFETVGGFVFTTFGRVPAKGEHVTFNSWRFTVMELDGRRIQRIALHRMNPLIG
jgi:CBS domain containing-hemolysin-like protein